MESMNLLDITIKYFNMIVFVMCILFGMISFLASWIAWREIHHKRNIMRSVIAAYNIAEDTLEKGTTRDGQLQLDPTVIQTVFNSIQEILNAIYGEVTGKPIPPREERTHGLMSAGKPRGLRKVFGRKSDTDQGIDPESDVPTLVPDQKEHQQSMLG